VCWDGCVNAANRDVVVRSDESIFICVNPVFVSVRVKYISVGVVLRHDLKFPALLIFEGPTFSVPVQFPTVVAIIHWLSVNNFFISIN